MNRTKIALCFSALLSLAAAGACARKKCVDGPVAAAPGSPQAAPATGKFGQVAGQPLVSGVRAFAAAGAATDLVVSFVPVKDQPFTEALRAETKARPKQPWDVQVTAKTDKAVEKGDVVLATFYFRTERSREESSEGQTEFVFELGKSPWTKSTTYPARASREWKKIYVPFVAAESHAAGEAQIGFRLGYEPQIVELGGVSIENFGKELALADLPVTRITYPGREPGAAWRAAAAQRIEELRKGALTVSVVDAQGKPVPGAEVRAELVRHAFGFGTCVPANTILEPESQKFRDLTRELFNMATLENDLKWVAVEGDYGPSFKLENAHAAVDWLRKNGLDVRGHVMVWPGWRNLPKSLRAHESDPVKLRTAVRERIRKIGTAMRGKVVHWDVLNEPYDNHDLMDKLGDDVMVEWFRDARAIDPGAKLFINDYAILSGGGGTTPHRDHYDKTIAFLLEKGAPVDGVGLQGHFGSSLTSPDDLRVLLDRYGRFKKPLWVTEYDVVIDDEELAGDYTRDFYTMLFSHPAVDGIVMWGFWDALHWKKNAALYRADWSLKPAGKAYRDLVLGAWRTDARGKSDAAGVFSTRGFLGKYAVRVSAGGKQREVPVELTRTGAALRVALP